MLFGQLNKHCKWSCTAESQTFKIAPIISVKSWRKSRKVSCCLGSAVSSWLRPHGQVRAVVWQRFRSRFIGNLLVDAFPGDPIRTYISGKCTKLCSRNDVSILSNSVADEALLRVSGTVSKTLHWRSSVGLRRSQKEVHAMCATSLLFYYVIRLQVCKVKTPFYCMILIRPTRQTTYEYWKHSRPMRHCFDPRLVPLCLLLETQCVTEDPPRN